MNTFLVVVLFALAYTAIAGMCYAIADWLYDLERGWDEDEEACMFLCMIWPVVVPIWGLFYFGKACAKASTWCIVRAAKETVRLRDMWQRRNHG